MQKHATSRNALIFALLAGGLAVLPALAEDPSGLPLRKAGVWELKTVMDEGVGPREHAFKICIEGSMELQTAQASAAEHRQNCASYEVKRENSVTTVNADCVFNDASVQSRTEMSGDFEKAFQIKIESTTVPPARGGQSRPVKRTITQTGSYLNSDCGELKGGEAMTGDGKKFMAQ